MKVLNLTEVINLTGLSNATIWRLEKTGNFPKRLALSENRVGWRESEIFEWIEGRPRVQTPVEVEQ